MVTVWVMKYTIIRSIQNYSIDIMIQKMHNLTIINISLKSHLTLKNCSVSCSSTLDDTKNNESKTFRYIDAKPDDPQWGLVTHTAGFAHTPPMSSYPPNQHPDPYNLYWDEGRVLKEYQLVYIDGGSGVFESKESRKQPVKSGDLILVFQDQWHRYKPDQKTGWKEYWIGFQGEIAEKLFCPPFFSPRFPVIKVQKAWEFLNGFLNIIQEIIQSPNLEGYVLGAKVIPLLAYLHQWKNQTHQGISSGHDKIQQAKAYLSQHYQKKINLLEIAKKFGLSYTKFRRDFKAYSGIPPNQYLQKVRLQQAKRLLCYSEKSIQEIATETGFQSPYYFSRSFKKHYSQSPNKLRK